MKKWFLHNRLFFLGGLMGAVAGYVYWSYWGCVNGCTITSNAGNSTLYFSLVGILMAGLLKKDAYGKKG